MGRGASSCTSVKLVHHQTARLVVAHHTHVETGARDLIMQLIWCAVGFVFCVAATALDYQLLKKFIWPVFIFALLLLGSVFVPHIGRASHGAHRWIGMGPFTFQPSELGKITLIYCYYSTRVGIGVIALRWRPTIHDQLTGSSCRRGYDTTRAHTKREYATTIFLCYQ